jgi:hypothetical protein
MVPSRLTQNTFGLLICFEERMHYPHLNINRFFSLLPGTFPGFSRSSLKSGK